MSVTEEIRKTGPGTGKHIPGLHLEGTRIMKKYLITVHPASCMGCRSCEMVCSLSHVGECNSERSRIRVVRSEEELHCVPVLCLDCNDAACEKACPTGATRRGGPCEIMLVDQKLCVGCSNCVNACPHGASMIDRVTEKAVRCDQCDGAPRCVDICPAGALGFMPADKVSAQRKRRSTQTLAAFIK